MLGFGVLSYEYIGLAVKARVYMAVGFRYTLTYTRTHLQTCKAQRPLQGENPGRRICFLKVKIRVPSSRQVEGVLSGGPKPYKPYKPF